jgi:phosphatidylserine/phosphatidylglycerophosphate/cardiolipin synthase-like enzyme
LDGLTPNRRRVYTLFYPDGLLHSKLIMVDDEVLSVGSANANPRGFFMDSELNIVLEDREAVKSFRHRLWAHNLGFAETFVAKWQESEFIKMWDVAAELNQSLQNDPKKMIGEGVIPFNPLDPSVDPRAKKGRKGPIRLPFPLPNINPLPVLF